MKRTFKSKIGLELLIPITVLLGTVLFLILNNGPGWLGAAIILSVLLFIVYHFLTTNYTIEGESLIIKCGILHNTTIKIQEIKRIAETRNPISSPAASLDRLEISFGQQHSVIISPKQKKAFIEAIVSLNPGIEVKYKSA